MVVVQHSDDGFAVICPPSPKAKEQPGAGKRGRGKSDIGAAPGRGGIGSTVARCSAEKGWHGAQPRARGTRGDANGSKLLQLSVVVVGGKRRRWGGWGAG
jgi:hypothetical protein